MRVHHENTEQYIAALAASVAKDPASLDRWRCLHLHPQWAHQVARENIESLKEANAHLDCDIVICPDNDLLIISRVLDTVDMNRLAAELIGILADDRVEVAIYDLFTDWRTVRKLLVAKSGNAVPAIAEPMVDFGDIAALVEVFAEAKRLRNVRQPQHVLIVEDDPLTRRLVTGAFKENYALITAQNAQEALACYLLHAPDIVLLDIHLPDADGFSVLRQILASDPDAYVVMFSGNSYLDNVTAALSQGAAGFIAKPFKKERLRHYIEDSLMHHRVLAGTPSSTSV